jgi:TetR/AcrR family transcriptional regulator
MPKSTFQKISEEKRERVLKEAARLFAERGYAQTDMAELAGRAQVSKGSLYDYFDGKEDLYLSVCSDGLERSRQAIYGGIQPDWDIFRQVRHMFRSGVNFALTYPEYVAMYLNVSSAGMEKFADELSLEVENYTSEYLKNLIRAGIDEGLVRSGVDVNLTAFLVNSFYIMFLASLVSRHYQIRIKEYLEIEGDLTAEAIEPHMERTIELIEQALRPIEGTA